MAVFYYNHEAKLYHSAMNPNPDELYHYGVKGMQWGKHKKFIDYVARQTTRGTSKYKSGSVGKPLNTLFYNAGMNEQRYNNTKANLATDKKMKDERKLVAEKQHMNREKATWGNKKANIEYDKMKQKKEYDLRQKQIEDRDRRERAAEGKRKREEAIHKDSKYREYMSDKALEKKNKDYKEATKEQRTADAKSKAERMKLEDAIRRENAVNSARMNAKRQHAANYRAQDRVLAEQEKARARRKKKEQENYKKNRSYYKH